MDRIIGNCLIESKFQYRYMLTRKSVSWNNQVTKIPHSGKCTKIQGSADTNVFFGTNIVVSMGLYYFMNVLNWKPCFTCCFRRTVVIAS